MFLVVALDVHQQILWHCTRHNLEVPFVPAAGGNPAQILHENGKEHLFLKFPKSAGNASLRLFYLISL